jgi:hypothetical protein
MKSGEIVLFEEEGPGFQPLHIQGHLARLFVGSNVGSGVRWQISSGRVRE